MSMINIVINAIRNVEHSYFLIPTTYKPEGIVRERVFCYELYHQIKLLMNVSLSAVRLHAEIDKSGHNDFLKPHRRNPDMVLHIPGTFSHNSTVCEIKGKIDREGILKDMHTLYLMISQYHYGEGLFILYNHDMRECAALLRQLNISFRNDEANTENITIITAANPTNIESDSLSNILNTQYNER